MRVLLLLLVLCSLAVQARPVFPDFRVEAAGHSWRSFYQAPEGPGPWPVVLILHGAGGSGPFYLDQCGWAEEARRRGFLAVAPEGLPLRPAEASQWQTNPRVWNTGQLTASAERTEIDDLEFFESLLEELPRRFPVDSRRFYVTGHSNGGGMALRLAVAWPERLAAVAPCLTSYPGPDPELARPVPTYWVLGTQDPVVPWLGGVARTPWGERPARPLAGEWERWARGLGYRGDFHESAGRDVTRRVYGPAFTGVLVEGQGHNWPGGEGGLPPEKVGPNGGWPATAEIWRYLSDHALAD